MRSAAHSAGTADFDARVVATFGRQFLVEDDDGRVWSATRRGKKGDVVVGDRVHAQASAPGLARIESVQPRASLLYRADAFRTKELAANIDLVLVVFAARPTFNRWFVWKALVAAHAAGIAPILVQNKTDLDDDGEAAAFRVARGPAAAPRRPTAPGDRGSTRRNRVPLRRSHRRPRRTRGGWRSLVSASRSSSFGGECVTRACRSRGALRLRSGKVFARVASRGPAARLSCCGDGASRCLAPSGRPPGPGIRRTRTGDAQPPAALRGARAGGLPRLRHLRRRGALLDLESAERVRLPDPPALDLEPQGPLRLRGELPQPLEPA